jgi:hypothetical protein
MKSEEKLNELFKTLREENVTTNISDVTTWINANQPITNLKSVKKTAITKKIIIMISIITTTIIGSIILFSGKQNIKPNKINSPSVKENRNILPIDSLNNASAESKKNKTVIPSLQINRVTPITNSAKDTLTNDEIKNRAEATLQSKDNMNKTNPHAEIQKSSRYWRSVNDTLMVDTIFNGVKYLVFKGDKSDLSIRGAKRSDISMKYNYQLRAKGVFSKKKEGNCELSYELKDSVLTIHVKQKDQKFKGVSVLSENSKLEFNVPENVDVRINSDLGDIDVIGLKANTIKIYTALGDITAKSVSGYIDLHTDLGDISMIELAGKINSVTSLGDIEGENILISEGSNLETSLGDIKIQLNNQLSECNLKLSTSLGHIKVDRADLKKKSRNQLTIGNGKLMGTMTTSLGKIIVR